MELLELIARLTELLQDFGLEDEGCVARVNGRDVIAAEFDGNTTIELLLEN